MCSQLGVNFIAIRPGVTWVDLYHGVSLGHEEDRLIACLALPRIYRLLSARVQWPRPWGDLFSFIIHLQGMGAYGHGGEAPAVCGR